MSIFSQRVSYEDEDEGEREIDTHTETERDRDRKRQTEQTNTVITPYFSCRHYIVYCQFVKICNKNLVIVIFISSCYCLMMNYRRTDRLSGIGICQSSMYLSLSSRLLLAR